MTFYEAALRVLESEGRPLTFLEITEKSIAENLLSHVGKTPELTMLSRLAAMARRTRDRKVIVTAKDTFALADWALPEDAEALAMTGVMEAHPEEGLPPMRPAERHPEPRGENVRSAGRGTERGKRRREEEEERGGRRRRFPPMPEVVFEILSESEQSLRPEQLLERAKSKELAGEDVTVEALLTALLEDNQRRIDAGRRPQFSLSKETGEVTLERAGAPSEAPPLELQAAFAAALGIPLQDGRPVLPKAGVAAPTAEAQADAALLTAARTAVKDARKAVARAVRKRLGELDVGTFEKSVVKMMHALGFRELKVAKRSKEGPLLTARKREGSVDLRYAIRMLKGTPALERKAVQELRKDLGHYSAQVGLLACAGDVRSDARTEAQASGSLVMLWCGDALGEKFLEAKAAVTVTTVELYDIDERFFEVAKLEAEEAQKRREERQREKQARTEEGEEGAEEAGAREARESEAAEEGPTLSRREERQRAREERRRERQARAEQARAEKSEAAQAPVAVAPTEAIAPAALSEEEQGEEGEEEGEDEDLEAASAFVAGGQPEGAAPGEGGGERKRRRRRRRGRRGRGGRGPEGAEGAAGAPGTPPGEAAAAAGEATAAEGAAATTGVTAGEGAATTEGAVATAEGAVATAEGAATAGVTAGEGAAPTAPVTEAAAPAAAEEAPASVPSEGVATPGEAVRTAAEWQSPFPSVESSAPAEAQRTAAEEYARVAAEKAESVAEGARPPSEQAPSEEPPPSGSGSPEGGTT